MKCPCGLFLLKRLGMLIKRKRINASKANKPRLKSFMKKKDSQRREGRETGIRLSAYANHMIADIYRTATF
jgi:hypothetical protein